MERNQTQEICNLFVSGQQFSYAYDNIGNRQSAYFGGDTSGNNLQTISYTANNLNQYTGIVTPRLKDIVGAALSTNSVSVNGGTADRKGEYFHRQISVANTNQPVWQSVTNVAGTTTNKGGLVFPAHSQTLVYDADGNLSFDGIWQYQWDGENRLIEMTMTNVSGIANSNRLQLQFAYDYLGRRIQKIISSWNGSSFISKSTNLFVYDGWNLLATINPQLSTINSFVWGNDLSGTMTQAGGVGGLLMANFSGTNCFAAYDGNGNITALINAVDKSLAARYEYSPYGELLRETGLLAHQMPFRYSTKFWDEESGLIFYPYRYYSPSLGKWINRDPTTDQLFLNLYLFCNNDTINGVDPNGKFFWLAATIAIGAGVGYVTHPDDPWRGMLEGAAAGALGFGIGGVVTEMFAGLGAAAASTIGATAGNVGSVYAGYAMDNYAANKNCWWVPDTKQRLVMAASGAGTLAAGALFGSMLARSNIDVDGAILDAELTFAASAGVGAAGEFGDAAEAAYDAGTSAIQNHVDQINNE